MLRALYAGVSGLSNHQAAMDVIGNNISNVNTIGFKAQRMTFMDAMNQTLSYGKASTENAGGKNPYQIGIGMKIGSVDADFSQGFLESTNSTTDLAIEGDGFFIVSNGQERMYTRAGAFQIDADGNLLSQGGGYFVQGKMANADGEISSGGTIGNIQIPFSQKSPPKATETIKYQCNLDASKDAKENILNANWAKKAQAEGGAVADYTSIVAGNDMTISVNGGANETVTIPDDAITPTSVSELISVLNSAIRGNSNLADSVEVVANEAGDGVVFQTKTSGGSDTTITVAGGTIDLSAAGLNITSLTGTGTIAGAGLISTDLNSLPFVTSDLNDGDTFTINGSNPDGSDVSLTFTYGAANDGTTVQDLITRINAAFSGATASLNEKGKLVLTDAVKGESQTGISLSFYDTDNSGSAISIPNFVINQKGEDAGSHTASIFVYDSLGNKHTVEIDFTKNQGEENLWNWEIQINGGDTDVITGGSGTVRFNNDGSIASMTSTDGNKLSFDPGAGASVMEIELDGGKSGSFAGITQYNSPFTTIAYEQDGYTMGMIQNIFFDTQGVIYADYTNGQSSKLAQISLADFTNPQGLLKTDSNLYKESPNSGQAKIGTAGTTISSSIRSGALENSNVDISKELTKMIITQRGFQINTKVITTSDQMLQEMIMRIIR